MQSCKWLHSYVFFFNCLLKLSARTDAKSHWLHLYAFSPKGVFRCFLKSPAWIDGKSQMVALVRFFQLSPQIICPKRCKVALVAFVRFFRCFLKSPAWTDGKSQMVALVRFFQLSPEIVCPKRCKVALVAFLHFFTWGSFQMFSQIACLNRWKVAMIAFERLFTWGSFQMFSQIACLNRWKVANGCTCTLFSTLSSNCVLELMQSHIFCIFVLFSRVSLSVLNLPACTYAKSHWWHLYAFSPEWVWMSSNCLPVQMQSHIDCIWTIFHLPSFVCPTQAQ